MDRKSSDFKTFYEKLKSGEDKILNLLKGLESYFKNIY